MGSDKEEEEEEDDDDEAPEVGGCSGKWTTLVGNVSGVARALTVGMALDDDDVEAAAEGTERGGGGGARRAAAKAGGGGGGTWMRLFEPRLLNWATVPFAAFALATAVWTSSWEGSGFFFFRPRVSVLFLFFFPGSVPLLEDEVEDDCCICLRLDPTSFC